MLWLSLLPDCDICMDKTVFSKYTGSDEYLRIPDDVTDIADRAFAGNKTLRHIDLGNVRYIGEFAFQDCSNLESVIMNQAGVIGSRAFEFCRSLRSVSFDSAEEIGEEAFSFCGKLDIPVIPRTVRYIGAGAFSHTAVKRVDLHWMESVPPSLFLCCTSLGYADISGAAEIGENAFAECRSLSYVRTGGVRKLGAKAFYKCDSLEFSVLPDTLREIGDDALCRIGDGLVIPKSVISIGRNCLGPVDRRKKISIYNTALYEFRNYFQDSRVLLTEDDEHFYMWESSVDVTVLDSTSETVTGFLPLYSDINSVMREALTGAFREDNTFDYSVFERVFLPEMKWNQRGKDRLAALRLRYPYGLSASFRLEYEDYIRKHFRRIAKRAVLERDIDMLVTIFDCVPYAEDSITEILDFSISVSAAECTAFLLERMSENDRGSDLLFGEL